MRVGHATCGGVLLVLLLGLTGCGDDSKAEVSGTVKVDGEPVADGAILFTPVNGKGQPAGGLIQDGTYSVKAPVAAMKVAIIKNKLVKSRKLYNTPNSPVVKQNAQVLPAKYSDNEKTELRYDVKPGVNHKDWELQTK
jgi:hypothetical protein